MITMQFLNGFVVKTARPMMTCLYISLLSFQSGLPDLAFAQEQAEQAQQTPRTGRFETSLPLFSPYADQGEIAGRMFHLSVSQQLFAHARSLGQELHGQVVDPSEENFHVYVPEDYDPSRSYGLFVWVSAREEVTVPARWNSVFAEHDIIFIAADKSGNRTHDLDRRAPLALHAVANMQHDYNIDKHRIYIGGLSGGGRVASKIAAAYGDLFTGGYFIAGSNAMGGKTVPVPQPAVLKNMREQGRYVFLTGRYDEPTTTATRAALASYQRLCVFNSILLFPRMGHGLPDLRWFKRGIDYLESGYLEEDKNNEKAINDCQASLTRELGLMVEAIDKLLDDNDSEAATDALKKLQLRYGRLAVDEFNRLYARLVDETAVQP